MMKIFVTGASGFLGQHIVRQLLADGHEVRVLLLPIDDAPGLAGLKVERCRGDLLQPEQYRACLEGCHAVVHAAGKVSLRARGRETMMQVHVEGLRHLLDAAAARRIGRFVLVSSMGILGARETPGYVDEDHEAPGPAVHRHAYHRSKWLAEKLFFETRHPSMEKIAVLPAMLWGPGDWNLSSTGYAWRALQGETLYYARTGGGSILDVEDAARGVRAALEQGRDGRRYVLAGENITIQQLCQAINRALPAPVRVRPVARPLIYALGAAAELLGWCGVDVDFSLDIARQSGNYWWAKGERSRQELGFAPRITAEEAIGRGVRWLVEHQDRFQHLSRRSRRRP